MTLQVNNEKRNITRLTAAALVLIILVWVLYVSFDRYETNKATAEKMAQFVALIQNNQYKDARHVFEYLRDIKDGDQEKRAGQMKEIMKSKFGQFSREVLEGKSGPAELEKFRGLGLFQEQFAVEMEAELARVTDLYLQTAINNETAAYYYETLQALGLNTQNINKYKLMAKAQDLKEKYKCREAMVILEKIAQDYPGDPLIAAKMAQYREEEKKLVVYDGPIQHIFFHPLIAYPELAFDNDYISRGYDDYFITVKEFKKILDSLYQKNFILIDINSIFDEKTENGKKVLVKKELRLPRDKKPLIISIDDLNYYDYMLENGNVHKLVLDARGNIATESVTPGGERVIAYDNEIVPILDEFVKKHPDFSFGGAKGVIALTGYQGILGYRTNELDSPNYEQEKEEVLRVVKRLKETGWTFASHGYGHRDAAKIGYETLLRDTERWKKEVETLVGPTRVYIYPYGSRVLPGEAKFQYLVEAGFRVLAAVGSAEYLKFTPGYIMMDRRHIDGIAFRYQRSRLLDLFDVKEIIDDVRLSKR